MNRSTRLRAAALVAAMPLAGCSSSHGFLGTDFRPRGDISVGIAGTPGTLTTSAAMPFTTTSTGFTIGLHETNFNGQFNVTITKWNNGFNIPCYKVHVEGTTLFLFSADNANPPTTPATQANPCTASSGDIEQAEIDDGIGNSVYFYYELV